MSTKRPADSPPLDESAPTKKPAMIMPMHNFGATPNVEVLDIKLLRVQNKNLAQRNDELYAMQEELQQKLAELERRLENDRTLVSVLMQSWSGMDENIRCLLARYTDEQEDTPINLHESTCHFLERLANRSNLGTQEEVSKNVAYSTSLVSRLLTLIDQSNARNLELIALLEQAAPKPEVPVDREGQEEAANTDMDTSMVDLLIRQDNVLLRKENERLHLQVTALHDKYAALYSECLEARDKDTTVQSELRDLHARHQELEYEHQKALHRISKLMDHMNEMQGRDGSESSTPPAAPTASSAALPPTAPKTGSQNEELLAELEEAKELAKSHTEEMEKMQEVNKTLLIEYEKLKMKDRTLSDEVVQQSGPYRQLQTQFTVLLNDASQLRSHFELAKKLLVASRQEREAQMEQLELEITSVRKKARADVALLERALYDTKHELSLVSMEREQSARLAEQSNPGSLESKHLTATLQNQNKQLKIEISRYKVKAEEAESLCKKLEMELRGKGIIDLPASDITSMSENADPGEEEHPGGQSGSLTIKNLKQQLKASNEQAKELKLLLDAYKGTTKDLREKAELLKSERMLRDDLEEMRLKILDLETQLKQKNDQSEAEDALQKLRIVEGRLEACQKELSKLKAENVVCTTEMEFMSQTCDETQDQNHRLLQQIREKDEANLKLMSERIKVCQQLKVFKEEKDLMQEQSTVLTNHLKELEELVRKMEDKEKVMLLAVVALEKEVTAKQQVIELHKKKTMESMQQVTELTVRCDDLQKRFGELQQNSIEKSTRLEDEAFKCRRLQEEVSSLKRKLERLKKMEYVGTTDAILVAEVQLYKNKLTCPCCNSRQKDAILSKCYHVFCFDCLKTRYDTRQRKCPKCNAPFGNNDFHKIYL